jgi:hypothetical protein
VRQALRRTELTKSTSVYPVTRPSSPTRTRLKLVGGGAGSTVSKSGIEIPCSQCLKNTSAIHYDHKQIIRRRIFLAHDFPHVHTFGTQAATTLEMTWAEVVASLRSHDGSAPSMVSLPGQARPAACGPWMNQDVGCLGLTWIAKRYP